MDELSGGGRRGHVNVTELPHNRYALLVGGCEIKVLRSDVALFLDFPNVRHSRARQREPSPSSVSDKPAFAVAPTTSVCVCDQIQAPRAGNFAAFTLAQWQSARAYVCLHSNIID